MRALGVVVVLPLMIAVLAIMARAVQRNVELDLRDGRPVPPAKRGAAPPVVSRSKRIGD